MPRSKEDITGISVLVKPEQHTDVASAANLVSRPKNPNYHTKDYTVNALSAQKIRDAKGKRDEVLSQRDVMGISATDVCSILSQSPSSPPLYWETFVLSRMISGHSDAVTRLQRNCVGRIPIRWSHKQESGQAPESGQPRYVFQDELLLLGHPLITS